VLLVEQNDLASGTSSASTKLIHGGLRYLELYEFRLVHEALVEREILLAAAPHIIRPLKFVLPHGPGLRPAWLLRLGLFLYDHLGRRKRLEGSHSVRLAGSVLGARLRPDYRVGFTYSDCWVDDARLVVCNLLDAQERGAKICVRTRLVTTRRAGAGWVATVEDAAGEREVEARVLVNAAGPWVSQVIEEALHVEAHKHVRLVKGSHIVLRKIYEGDHAYIFQNPDKRIVFAIPYEQEFTLVGSTDVPHKGAPGKVEAGEAETDYLLASINRFFAYEATRDDIVWSYAGLRPLYDDGALNASVVTRDYAFDLDAPAGAGAALSVFGGKITTARRLAEHALRELASFLPQKGGAWTQGAVFPGGDLGDDFDAFVALLIWEKPFLALDVAHRLARAYGTGVFAMLGEAQDMAALGRDFGGGLSEAEIRYLVEHEWARSGDDVLWRRSKLGLHMTPAQREAVAAATAQIVEARKA
jgi:glycerol-3-phosphate dehydrogenase